MAHLAGVIDSGSDCYSYYSEKILFLVSILVSHLYNGFLVAVELASCQSSSREVLTP